MKVKPILFNTEMVRAILDGKKSCTRRVVKTRRKDVCGFCVTRRKADGLFAGIYEYDENESMFDNQLEPPYQPGDILYVRETVWQKVGHYLDIDGETKGIFYNEYKYVATDDEPKVGWNHSWVKRPSIHMPKKAARIWLKVTDVRVEQLQDITSEQICKEGAEVEEPYILNGEEKRYAFANLWNSTIKNSDINLYGWDANPFVWVIGFE